MARLNAFRTLARALAFSLGALAALPVAAGPGPSEPQLEPAKVVALSEAALGRELRPHVLTDSESRPLPLGEYRGRPLVISLVYTSCSSVCPATTQHLLAAVRQARKALGTGRFAVLTVGFDARHDTPRRLASFAEQQGIDGADWRLASADEATLAGLLEDLGFSYLAVAGGFEHITQTSIVGPKGRIYRHVYGDDFPLPVFVEPLKELVYGTTARDLSLGSMLDRLKFLCTVYDPNLGRYRTSYALALGAAAGSLALFITGWFIVGAWRRTLRGGRPVAES